MQLTDFGPGTTLDEEDEEQGGGQKPVSFSTGTVLAVNEAAAAGTKGKVGRGTRLKCADCMVIAVAYFTGLLGVDFAGNEHFCSIFSRPPLIRSSD